MAYKCRSTHPLTSPGMILQVYGFFEIALPAVKLGFLNISFYFQSVSSFKNSENGFKQTNILTFLPQVLWKSYYTLWYGYTFNHLQCMAQICLSLSRAATQASQDLREEVNSLCERSQSGEKNESNGKGMQMDFTKVWHLTGCHGSNLGGDPSNYLFFLIFTHFLGGNGIQCDSQHEYQRYDWKGSFFFMEFTRDH